VPDFSQTVDVIRIDRLAVDCVVGVYPEERDTPQPLLLDVALSLSTEVAARNERLSATVDYARTAAQLSFLLRSCRFRLLETAAHVLCRYLLLPPASGRRGPRITSVRLRLEKPAALAGAAIPSLMVERDAAWASYVVEEKPFGTVDVVHETKDTGIYRLNVAPGREIPLHYHARMNETEMVLDAGLHCQGRAVAAGTVHRWPHGAAHCYRNPTRRVLSILCVDSPAFIESDEITTAGEPAEVAAESEIARLG
jgi:dihydroneopterin aldolase